MCNTKRRIRQRTAFPRRKCHDQPEPPTCVWSSTAVHRPARRHWPLASHATTQAGKATAPACIANPSSWRASAGSSVVRWTWTAASGATLRGEGTRRHRAPSTHHLCVKIITVLAQQLNNPLPGAPTTSPPARCSSWNTNRRPDVTARTPANTAPSCNSRIHGHTVPLRCWRRPAARGPCTRRGRRARRLRTSATATAAAAINTCQQAYVRKARMPNTVTTEAES